MNMKQSTGLGRRTASGLFSIGAALALCFGLSVSAQAQDCTVANWDNAQNLLDGADNDSGNVGFQDFQANNFRRYAGPCGLRVPFGSSPAWVENTFQQGTTTSLDEPVYIARFYAFLDNLTGTGVPIFEGYNASDLAAFTVYYSDSGTLGFDADGNGSVDDTVSVGSGWHSIEIVYSATDDQFTISVDGTDTVLNLTLSENVAAVRMGDIDGAGGGTADFDDFDSRRVDRPGRLCRGDTNGDNEIRTSDVLAAWAEASTFGAQKSPGQPDYNEDGLVRTADVLAMWNNHAAVFNFGCPTP